jgi:F-type H+-transporting ATPase subunit gamma
MASLLEVKKKISGVKNTKKITKAMKLVATAKMRQFQKRALSARTYAFDLLQVLRKNLHGESASLFTEKRKEGKVLFVVYTSDKGLCGALNTNILKALTRSEKWNSLKASERMLLTIGKKARDFAKANKIHVDKHFIGIPENFAMNDMLDLVDGILEYWLDKSCREIVFIAPHFHNTFTFYPVARTFLPFSPENIDQAFTTKYKKIAKETDEKQNDDMVFEPNNERVNEVLFLQIIQSLLLESFFELKASEYSSRMIAMQNATDAADKMINELTLVYNKTRQQAITQQIAELVGGMDAV